MTRRYDPSEIEPKWVKVWEDERLYEASEDPDDDLWERLHLHFSDEEIVELGYFVGVTFGQQSWIRTLDIGHHEVLDTSAEGLAHSGRTM